MQRLNKRMYKITEHIISLIKMHTPEELIMQNFTIYNKNDLALTRLKQFDEQMGEFHWFPEPKGLP